jgi:oxygen-independent coproporphyrinogen-3 oxidase
MAGIYLHIPFCKQACYYCDFHFSTTMRLKDDFVKALLDEIKLQKDYLDDEPIKTIYFGGGTPSLLTYDNLMEILDTIFATYIIGVNPEITLEANPDDLSLMKLKELSKTPINRLSIGVQSFFDEDLRFMNRVHNANEAIKSIKYAQDVGLDNLTIDLIYGTPTLSYDNWKKNLETAFSLEIPHLSCYCLTIEPKTALADFIKKGKTPNVDEQMCASQFEIMLELMEKNGYEQYEISNFCKDERYSKHNSAYWLKENYLGLGPSAHSFNGNSRQWNIANNSLYIESISKGIIPQEKEILTIAQQFNEYILTSLRTKWGVNIYRVEKDFGGEIKSTFMKQVNEYIDKGLLVLDDKKEVVLLTKEGKLLADNITSDLFLDA